MPSFDERTRFLESQVGTGDLVMGLVVHQHYAADQHVETHYKHPGGGIAKYVEIPYVAKRNDFLKELARNAVTEGGSDLSDAATSVAKQFDDIVKKNAPDRLGILQRSGNVYVTDNGRETYRKSQEAPFLYDKE